MHTWYALNYVWNAFEIGSKIEWIAWSQILCRLWWKTQKNENKNEFIFVLFPFHLPVMINWLFSKIYDFDALLLKRKLHTKKSVQSILSKTFWSVSDNRAINELNEAYYT